MGPLNPNLGINPATGGLPLLGTVALAEHIWLNQTSGNWKASRV